MADTNDSMSNEISLRQFWKTGEKYQVVVCPSVEGMVASTKWISEVLMVVFVMPPYMRADGSQEKAALLLQTASSCTRTKLRHYDFPFPTDTSILTKIIKAKGDPTALQEVTAILNNKPNFLPLTPVSIIQEEPVNDQNSNLLQDSLAGHVLPTIPQVSDQVSVQLALSQSDEPPTKVPKEFYEEDVLNHLARELSKRLTFTQPPSEIVDSQHVSSRHHHSYSHQPSPPPPPDCVPATGLKRQTSRVRHHHHHSSSSSSSRTGSSSSSSRTSSSYSEKSHVRPPFNSKPLGAYGCPFTQPDTRLLSRPYRNTQAKSEERKYLRRALCDLYGEYTTLKNFVDSINASIAVSPTKPYTLYLIWLQQHAEYLDSALLHLSLGPWTIWNELLIDKLTRAFLELVVRVSPKRAYPDLLDESVRKWVKRKRIGICSKFGPIPAFLAQAKVTDSGIEPRNGWENPKAKETLHQYGSATTQKNKPPNTGGGEKK